MSSFKGKGSNPISSKTVAQCPAKFNTSIYPPFNFQTPLFIILLPPKSRYAKSKLLLSFVISKKLHREFKVCQNHFKHCQRENPSSHFMKGSENLIRKVLLFILFFSLYNPQTLETNLHVTCFCGVRNFYCDKYNVKMYITIPQHACLLRPNDQMFQTWLDPNK